MICFKRKVCGNPVSSMSTRKICPTGFAHFRSLGHILVILTVFQAFSLLHICYHSLDLWSVISDVTIVIVLGHHELCLCKTRNLINKCCVFSDHSTNWPVPSICLLRTSYFWDIRILILNWLNNPPVASKHSSERKSLLSLTLNQKLEMIKLNKEGMLKAEMDRNLALNS